MAVPPPSEVRARAELNERAVRVAELIRDPSIALIVALDLRDLFHQQYRAYIETLKTDQGAAIRKNAELQRLHDMTNVLEGKHGLSQIGSIAYELFMLAKQGALSEPTLVALGMIPIPEQKELPVVTV